MPWLIADARNLSRFTVNPIKLETGLRPNRAERAGIPYLLLLRIEAMGFPTFWLLLYTDRLALQSRNSLTKPATLIPKLHILSPNP